MPVSSFGFLLNLFVSDIPRVPEDIRPLAYGARAQDASFNITLEREFDRGLAPTELAPQEMARVFLNRSATASTRPLIPGGGRKVRKGATSDQLGSRAYRQLGADGLNRSRGNL